MSFQLGIWQDWIPISGSLQTLSGSPEFVLANTSNIECACMNHSTGLSAANGIAYEVRSWLESCHLRLANHSTKAS